MILDSKLPKAFAFWWCPYFLDHSVKVRQHRSHKLLLLGHSHALISSLSSTGADLGPATLCTCPGSRGDALAMGRAVQTTESWLLCSRKSFAGT